MCTNTVLAPARSRYPSVAESIDRTPMPTGPRRSPLQGNRKLTLSAYRRPEVTVRLTDSDPIRRLEDEYDLRSPGCKTIGYGAFSTVRSALRKTDGAKVAVKSVSKCDALRARRLQRRRQPKGPMPRRLHHHHRHLDEWEIMRLLRSNPHVLTLHDVFETDEEIYLVTEFCEEELFDTILRKVRRGRFSEPQAARIAGQVLVALAELHSRGIVHGDVKPENILLLRGCRDGGDDDGSLSSVDDIEAKLCDFGAARRCHRRRRDENEFGCAASAADIFSLGATLHVLLCGFPPAFCEETGAVRFPEAYWKDVSEEATEVVRSMLRRDPRERVSAADALKNAWIRQERTTAKTAPVGRREPISVSVSANLELVRSHLMRSMATKTRSSSFLSMASPPPPKITRERSRKRSDFENSAAGPKRPRTCYFNDTSISGLCAR